MTNRRKFFVNGIMLTAVGLAIRSVSLLLNSYIKKNIGAEGVGLFTLIGTVYSFAVTFATSGISLTVTKKVSEAVGEGREKDIRGILRSSIIYALVFSTFSTAVLFFGASYFAEFVLSDARCEIPLKIMSISLMPIALSSVFGGYFVGVKRVSRNATVQLIGQVFKILLTVFAVGRFSHLGVSASTIALSASMTLTEITVFAVAYIQFAIDKKRKLTASASRKNHFQRICSMALPLALSAYIRSALLTLEHVLIPKRLRDGGTDRSDALSQYGILHGMALPMLLYPMATLSSFSGLLVPEFSESAARNEKSRLERLASEALNTTLCYSVGAMTFLLLFSEELGYVFYNSYDAGHYIAIMAPVVPIMYLDHVADSMLKGIGEHVYSMWVNISDSMLSIMLVWILIPILGIGGYAVVIVVMEGYNFILSAVRLYGKIKFRIKPVKYLLLPGISAIISAELSKRFFTKCGAMTEPVWLFCEMAFAVCAFLALYFSVSLLLEKVSLKRKSAT